MLTFVQAVVLGGLQGIAELFPISSLGHSVLLPGILHWNIQEDADYFLVFLVATHLATALVLFLFYWEDWSRIIRGIFRSLATRRIDGDVDAKMGWLLIVGTIPAGLIGFLLQHKIQAIFASPRSVAIFLALNGVLLIAAEYLRRRREYVDTDSDAHIAAMSFTDAFIVGIMQILALLPGFSRTGASLAGGLFVGLSHRDALRFSFLLATPIIGAAALLKLPSLFHAPSSVLHITLIGALVAAIFAFVSIKFLTRYFRAERHTQVPFAIYCLVAGISATVYLYL